MSQNSEMEVIEMLTLSQINLNTLKDGDLKEYYQSVFLTCDTNNDGFISIKELKHFIEKNEKLELPDEAIERISKKYDKNMDKQLDFEEFIEMIHSRTFSTTFQKISCRILKFVVKPPRSGGRIELSRRRTATGTYEDEMKFRKTAVGMIFLSILQMVIFYVDDNKVCHALAFKECRRYEIYRYLTFMLMHSGNIHLYGNIVFQLLLGIPLELVHTWRIPLLYFAGSIGGSLFHSAIHRINLTGGSAGAYSFLAAHVAVVILNWREMRHPAVRLIFFAIILMMDMIYRHKLIASGTSYWSHFGGIVVGLLLGVNILKNLRVTRMEKLIWYISLLVLGITVLILIILNITIETVCPVEMYPGNTSAYQYQGCV